jgi:hypothetical protein
MVKFLDSVEERIDFQSTEVNTVINLKSLGGVKVRSLLSSLRILSRGAVHTQ